MLKRLDHIGVVVDNLDDAARLLTGMGMELQEELEVPGRLKVAFFRCGTVEMEILQIHDDNERKARLGNATARLEHLAFEVDDIGKTVEALSRLGVQIRPPGPAPTRKTISCWTIPETSDGVLYQLIQKV